MFAVLNFFGYPADFGIGHLRAFSLPANDNGHAVTPSVAWLTPEHRDALIGLADSDARKQAYLACVEVDMGSTQSDGTFPLDKQATLAAASAPRRKVEGHGFL